VFAHAEAEVHYSAALELARDRDDQARQAEAALKLGATLRILARYDEAAPLLEQALSLYHALADRQGAARTMAQIGRLAMARHTIAEGAARLRAFLADADTDATASPSTALGGVWMVLAGLLANHTLPDNEGALAAAGRAAELARALGENSLLAGAEMTRGLALYHLSRLEEARGVLRQAVMLAEATHEYEALMRALNVLAHVDSALGDFTTFRPYHERALIVAERIGDPRGLKLYAANLALESESAGELVQARHGYTRAIQTLRRMGAGHLASQLLSHLGWLGIWEGTVEDGLACLAEAEALAQNSGDRALAVLNRAWFDVWEGRYGAAIQRLEAVIADSETGKESLSMALVVLGEAYLEAGNDARGRAHLAGDGAGRADGAGLGADHYHTNLHAPRYAP
jgi:tetratricopeptide (TPR) repeat protein